ncbi:MAG: hypothetical protein KDB82_17530 [Planctomycetes bacterium]|nr:hypothetical protein [Planctomycetota bacterium]
MRFALLTLLLLAPTLLSATSYAPEPPISTYESENGRFVYVQLSYEAEREPHLLALVHSPWKQTGLYRAEDPDHPLWTTNLELWSWWPSCSISDDGEVVAVAGLDNSEITFYRNGEPWRRW